MFNFDLKQLKTPVITFLLAIFLSIIVTTLVFFSRQSQPLLIVSRFLMIVIGAVSLKQDRRPNMIESCAAIGLLLGAVCIDGSLFTHPPISKIDQTSYSITGLLDTLCLGPVAEELFFRGTCWRLTTVSNRWMRWMPLVTTSVLFGLYHFAYWSFVISIGSVQHVISTFFAGIIFGLVRFGTRGVLWPTVLHMVANSCFLLFR